MNKNEPTKYTVNVLGKGTWQADDFAAALQSLPERHAMARIWAPGTQGNHGLPVAEFIGGSHRIPAGNLQIGDVIEVVAQGAIQDSGGGKYRLIERRTMTVTALVSEATIKSGNAEDDADFVSGGQKLFAVLTGDSHVQQ